MKCLENLSLIDDEMIEDLQKDIEELINKYAKIDKKCEKLFKELRIKNAFKIDDINKICKIIQKYDKNSNTPIFLGKPKCITNLKSIHSLADFFDFEDKDLVMEEFIHLLNQNFKNNHENITNGKFWIYRDGTNWEIFIKEEYYFLEYIEKCIPFYEKKELYLELLKELEKIKNKNEI